MKYNITMNEKTNLEIFEFEDKDHCNLLCEKLNILRKNKQFCDVILQVGTPQDIHEIYGHRAILASASRYFLDVFSNDITYAPCGIPQFQLYKLLSTKYDVDAFNHILDYIYTSRLEIPKKHVRNVYALASRLKMTTIAQKCGEFLASTLTPETCLHVRATNGVLNDPMLLSSVDNYIKENIAEVIKCKFVEQLEKIKIEVLQNSDEEIDSVNPRHLFNMISDWIRKEFEENKMSNNQLLLKTYMLYLNVDRSLHDCLDIENGDYNYSELIVEYKDLSRKLSTTKRSTENVDSNIIKNISLKTESNGAINLIKIQNSQKENNLETTKNEESNHSVIQSLMKNNNKNTAPSKPKQFLFTRSDSDSSLSSIADEDENDWKVLAVDVKTKNNMNGLLMVAGKLFLLTVKLTLHSPHSSRNNSIEKPEICSTLAFMNNVRCALGSACLNDQLVVCGGYDRSNCLNTVEVYDSTQNKWIYLAPMNKARARFSITVLDDKIYAVGGSDGQKELKSAEVYDPIEKNWKFISKSPIGRSNASVCTLNGEIYLIGGWNGQTGLQRCDAYNPKTDTWRRISDLQIGRYQVSVTVLNNQIYAVGGCGTWTCLNSVERYDPEKDEWSLIQPMHTVRRGCGVISFENKIYVIGGHDGIYSLCSCEIYNPKDNTWSKGPSLTVCRANVAVSVVKNTIYAVGGFSGKNFLNSFEYLDIKNNEWTTFLKKVTKNSSLKLVNNFTLETKYEMNENDKNELEDNQTNGDKITLNGDYSNHSGFSNSKSKEPLVEVEGETAVESN